MTDLRAVTIYIDGSALDNPGGRGGSAAWIEYPLDSGKEPEELFSYPYAETKSGRAELNAAIKALEWVGKNTTLLLKLDATHIVIVTDSRHVMICDRSATYWKKDKWKLKSGRPIENPDLVKKFLLLKGKTKIHCDFEWQKGKSTEILRNVDRSAKKASRSFIGGKDYGYNKGKISPTTVSGSAQPYHAQTDKCIIRIYRKILSGDQQYKVHFEIFDLNEDKCTEKYYAYCDKEIEEKIKRQHYYQARFNKDEKYPQIIEIIKEINKK
jgi:ribonuclease HI